ncbi:hypothetical protein MAR_016835 [Mya arenaria]|uniref:Uncharacterized protein n=1 Tax=Mya arenaria TaxID=6604 RepID=A0ABY7EA10_MYAAR|nr:hypothetical protein MAR_016835 [Mya arenaria]
MLLAAVALYLVKKKRKNNNGSAQLTQDIELQTIIGSSNGSCVGGETSEEYPHEHQHLLGSRSDLTTANATGAIVWSDNDPMAFPRQASTPSVMTNAVLDTITLTENSRVAGVPGLPPVSEDNEEGSHTTNCTVKVKNFKRVIIDRNDLLDCDVTIRTRETRV